MCVWGGGVERARARALSSLTSPPSPSLSFSQAYAKEHFPATPHLDYASAVEAYTLTKAPNLVLNVDGCIGAAWLDLLAGCGRFSPAEAAQVVEVGTLNGLFVLARSIGLIGHALDQKRLGEGLYRHPWDSVLYGGGGEGAKK